MSPIRTTVASAAAALLATATLFASATSAGAADPVTSTEEFPDGTISAAFSDTTAGPGDAFTVTVTFSNTSANNDFVAYEFGAEDSNGDPLFVLDSCTTTPNLAGTCDTPGNRVRFTSEQSGLAAGQSASVTFNAHVNDTAAAGTYDVDQSGDFGSVARKGFDPSVEFTVEQGAEADIGVDLSASSGLLSSQIIYNLAVDNDGPADATGVEVMVDLPSQTSNVTGLPSACTYNASSDEVTCNYNLIAAGGSRAPSFTATMGLLSIGQLPATATRIASNPTDPNPTNDTNTANCTVLTSLIITCS